MTEPRKAAGASVAIDRATKSFAGARANAELTAVDDVSLRVEPGEFIALVGPSGCGKSTLLRLVAGLEHPTRGTVRIGGHDVVGPDPQHGVVFQKPALFPWLNVIDNVTFGPRMQGNRRDRRRLRSEAERYLAAVGLRGFENHKVYELSGGMMHRVALARVLINRPVLLLMDEPFGALDAQTRLVMQELLIEIWQQDQSTVLFVTHDVDEALLLADRTVVMTARPGRIKEVYDVNIERPRGIDTLTSDSFSELKRSVLHSIRKETQVMLEMQEERARAHSLTAE